MNKNTLSPEAETRLIDFFNHTIDPSEMAKAIRHANHILALGVIREHKILEKERTSLENSFYWLNELVEILNPYLCEE